MSVNFQGVNKKLVIRLGARKYISWKGRSEGTKRRYAELPTFHTTWLIKLTVMSHFICQILIVHSKELTLLIDWYLQVMFLKY